MKEILPYGELWLLERGVECDGDWVPLLLLPHTQREREQGFSELFNCDLHGLSTSDLADMLWKLFAGNEIEFNYHAIEFNCRAEDQQHVVSPTEASDVHAWLLEEQEYREVPPKERRFRRWYRVTGPGIARWEAYAIPNWNKYRGDFTGRLYEGGETTWSQTTVTEPFAREVFEAYAMDVWHPAQVHWDTLRVEHRAPWAPFRGKELPAAVTVSVEVTEHGSKEEFTAEEWMAVRTVQEEHWRRFCDICHWYEKGTSNHPERPDGGSS